MMAMIVFIQGNVQTYREILVHNFSSTPVQGNLATLSPFGFGILQSISTCSINSHHHPSIPMKLRLLYLFVVAARAAIGSEFEAAGEDSILYPAIGTESNEANNDSVLYHHSPRGNLRRVTPSTRTKTKTTPGENYPIIQQTYRNRKLEEYEWVGRNPTVKLTRCQGEHMIG